MSKRVRLNESKQEPEQRTGLTRRFSLLEKLPRDLLRIVREFGEYGSQQQRVSRQWRSEAAKYCETRTKHGATCLRENALAPSCVQYCLGPGPCVAWMEPLLRSMESASRALTRNQDIPLREGTATVVVGYAAGELQFDGKHWTMRFNYDLWVERDASFASDMSFTPEEGDGVWRMDAHDAARVACYLCRVEHAEHLFLSFAMDVPDSDLGLLAAEPPGTATFLDANGLPVDVGGGNREWNMFPNMWVGPSLSTTIELRDTHTLWCERAMQQGRQCIAEGNRAHRGCASYCLTKASGCRNWTFDLLHDLATALQCQGRVTVPCGSAPLGRHVIAIQPESLRVNLLDDKDQNFLHLAYRKGDWWVSDTTPVFEAWQRRKSQDSPAAGGREVALASAKAESVHQIAANLLCFAFRNESARTLRAEIAYSLPSDEQGEQGNILARAGSVPGTNLVFVCDIDRYSQYIPTLRPTIALKHVWQITPSVLRIDIRIG